MEKAAIPIFSGFEQPKSGSIDEDLSLYDSLSELPPYKFPLKHKKLLSITCVRGTIVVRTNFEQYIFKAPCIITIFPNYITEEFSVSKDFSCRITSFSKQFMDHIHLNIKQSIPAYLYLISHPCTSLSRQELKIQLENYATLKHVMERKNLPCRYETAVHLIHAFSYINNGLFLKNKKEKTQISSRQEELLEKFIDYVQRYHKEHRGLEFYANKLCLTAKHLSTVVKKSSNKSANRWIDEQVILEAKSLLRTTNMSVQQIGDELNFASQSFFGKYFKRIAGMSPKEYREGL